MEPRVDTLTGEGLESIVNLFHVLARLCNVCGLERFTNPSNGKRGKSGNESDHDEEFDEGKSPFFRSRSLDIHLLGLAWSGERKVQGRIVISQQKLEWFFLKSRKCPEPINGDDDKAEYG